jgi:hypothetical protein
MDANAAIFWACVAILSALGVCFLALSITASRRRRRLHRLLSPYAHGVHDHGSRATAIATQEATSQEKLGRAASKPTATRKEAGSTETKSRREEERSRAIRTDAAAVPTVPRYLPDTTIELFLRPASSTIRHLVAAPIKTAALKRLTAGRDQRQILSALLTMDDPTFRQVMEEMQLVITGGELTEFRQKMTSLRDAMLIRSDAPRSSAASAPVSIRSDAPRSSSASSPISIRRPW